MMQYKGIKGQWSFFFLKILERDLKLACLIPTHCTGKASCSYCTGPHQLGARAGAVPKVLRWLPTCLPTRSLAIRPGLDLPSPHFHPVLNTDKEMSWQDERQMKDLSLLWLVGWRVLEPSFLTHQVDWAARIIFLSAILTQVCPAITSGWSVMRTSRTQELAIWALSILL